MSQFVVSDALLAGFRETARGGILYLVFLSYASLTQRKYLLAPFFLGISVAFLTGLSAPYITALLPLKGAVGNLISGSFALFFIFSCAALLQSSELPLFEPFRLIRISDFFYRIATLFLAVLFFLPEATGTGFAAAETALMREGAFVVYFSLAAGAAAGGILIFPLGRLTFVRKAGEVFDVPQILLLCAILKLFGSGMKGIEQITLIPSVQAGLMKFFHDFVHQNFVLFMVPDHMLLRTTAWNFIGIFFGANFALFVSLLLLLSVPLFFLYRKLLREPVVPAVSDAPATGAVIRKLRHAVLSERRKKAAPVIFFVFLIVTSWYVRGGQTSPRLYNPAPKPLVADNGLVRILISDPTMDLKDGRIHKFSLAHQGKNIRILVVRKPDSRFSVCLDACEICPPEGYGQKEDLLVCIYCNTPIPVRTLGRPGGCNPIPLEAASDNSFISIKLDELLKKTALVNAGKSGEPGR